MYYYSYWRRTKQILFFFLILLSSPADAIFIASVDDKEELYLSISSISCYKFPIHFISAFARCPRSEIIKAILKKTSVEDGFPFHFVCVFVFI